MAESEARELEVPPEGWPVINDVMSNFDHEIDREVERELKERESVACYPAMNFCGWVWWSRASQQWLCCVMRYHQHVATLRSESLEGIMEQACEEWGAA